MTKKIPELETEFLYGKAPKVVEYEEVDVGGNKTGKRSEVIVFAKDGEEIVNPDYEKLYDEGYRPVPSTEDSKYNNIGCIRNGFEDKLQECINIFDVMRAFSQYAFNKSHSGCYGVLAYKTGWLSYYYPLEFAYACLKAYGDKDKKVACIQNAKKRGVKVLQPNINESNMYFGIKKDEEGKNEALLFGFCDIDGIGEKASKVIVAERNANGPYKDLIDFIDRLVDNKTDVVKELSGVNKAGNISPCINKGHINALIKAGAFDKMNPNRYALLNLYNMQLVKTKDKNFVALDESLFETARRHKLELDKETMGFYISEHPLEPFPYADFDKASEGTGVVFTGIVLKSTTKKTKTGKQYDDVIVEVKDGTEKLVRFWSEQRKLYSKIYKRKTDDMNILIFHGKYSPNYGNVTCNRVQELVVVGNNNNNAGAELEDLKSPIPVIEQTPTSSLEDILNNMANAQ